MKAQIQWAVAEIDEHHKMALKNGQDQAQSSILTQLRDHEQRLRDQLRDKEKQIREVRLSALANAAKAAVPFKSGTLPFPGVAKVRFSKQVWLEMCQSVQMRVMELVAALDALKKVKALSNMRSDISIEKAQTLGIKVLHSENGKVLLGAFDVPDVDKIIASPPTAAGA